MEFVGVPCSVLAGVVCVPHSVAACSTDPCKYF